MNLCVIRTNTEPCVLDRDWEPWVLARDRVSETLSRVISGPRFITDKEIIDSNIDLLTNAIEKYVPKYLISLL